MNSGPRRTVKRPLSTRSQQTRRLVFAGLALMLLTLQLWSAIINRDPLDASLLWSIPLAACLACSGWYPRVGGAAVIGIATLASLLPNGLTNLGPLFLGIFAVALDWVSRGWLAAAALALLVPQSAQLSSSDLPLADMLGVVLGSSVALVGGLVIRHLEQRELSSEEARAAAEQVQGQIRRDLASTLHDTLAADLVRIALSSHSLARLIKDPETVEIAQELEEASRSTLRDLRAVIAATKDRQPDETTPTTESVVQTCRSMLSARNIGLEAHLPEDLDARCSPALRRNVVLITQEGAVNILKYGKAGSVASLSIEISKNHEEIIDLMFSNECSTELVKNQEEISAGSGLESLSARIASTGGFLDASQRGRRWVLVAQLVGRVEEHT